VIISNGKLVADGTSTSLRKQAQNKEILKVTIEDGDRNAIFYALKALETIEVVDLLPEHTQAFEVLSKAGANSRRAIFKLCVDNSWALTEMTPVERKLEEVFRDLTINN
jgi:ABC-2 type transport system ATP-binding protein